MIESAILGRGIALAKSALAAEDIRAGRLVRPLLRTSRPVDFAYYLVARKRQAQLPKVVFFRDWLRTQTSGDANLEAVA